MREIELLDLRWHIGQPTWEIIDELLEHIDSSDGVTPEDLEFAKSSAYDDGFDSGYDNGFGIGAREGYTKGYSEGFMDGKRADGD